MGSSEKVFRIGLVAPGTRMPPELARRAQVIAAKAYGGRVELVFHPQCFLQAGHFAGEDHERIEALVEVANDPALDAVWLARGGYGACRVAEYAIPRLNAHAQAKRWLGYSDAGFLLAGLCRAGFEHVAHGPMPVDLVREDGEPAMLRGLAWLVNQDRSTLEPSLRPGQKALAFNLTILSQLLGTPLEPDFAGRVLMLEDVGEYMYRIDRYMFHVTSNAAVKGCAGIRLGRCSAVPKNDPDFVLSEHEVARFWCERSGIPYLGRADIGHDSDNRVVPLT
ncbi:MAG: LD-carboxypeptidase [Alphaproteobacteria bacterium 32-64-14]|nr:MAG: LD-carboxypeptidase [Alphaproteobacteria bacterium 32-64-14]